MRILKGNFGESPLRYEVLIDAFTNREPFAKMASAVLLTVELGEIDRYITPNAPVNANYHLGHCLHSKKSACKYVESFLGLFRIIDLAEADCYQALGSKMLNFEDAVLAFMASRNNFDLIATRNVKNFKNSPVLVATPQVISKKLGVPA